MFETKIVDPIQQWLIDVHVKNPHFLRCVFHIVRVYNLSRMWRVCCAGVVRRFDFGGCGLSHLLPIMHVLTRFISATGYSFAASHLASHMHEIRGINAAWPA